ncbi:hypothetical protein CDEST_07918 [Colletotrichum destructivum]|uniref:Uncharacterized protein n=1 Tax=Colletotrichum destructivum TaxID=34406 RepID=A0AAX4II05_9PEZI|nr:hypothetical protein CDEST_07918 [Colletotrichum destructivum]
MPNLRPRRQHLGNITPYAWPPSSVLSLHLLLPSLSSLPGHSTHRPLTRLATLRPSAIPLPSRVFARSTLLVLSSPSSRPHHRLGLPIGTACPYLI